MTCNHNGKSCTIISFSKSFLLTRSMVNPKLFIITLSCLFFFVLPQSVFAQNRLITSTTEQNGAWIVSKRDDNGVFVWGAGFGEILELTPEQTDDLQEVIAKPDSNTKVGFLETNDSWTKLKQVLTPEQLLKYTEISFQAAGGLDSYLHLNDQLLDIVNLTDAQKGQIQKLATERTAEYWAERSKRPEMPPFDWQKATQEERDKYTADFTAASKSIQMAFIKNEPELFKRYSEQIKAVLTAEQRAKAEKLTAEAPELVEKFMGKKQDASKQSSRTPYIYVPHAGSWQPGDPLPEGYRQQRSEGRFPRNVQSE